MKKILSIVISLVFLLTACSSAQPETSGPASAAAGEFKGVRAVMKQQPIQPVNGAFVNGINAFGFNSAALLYDSNENLAFSPVSLELALAMTRTGAAGQTADEMANALSLAGISDDDIKTACRSLMWRSNTGGMEAANSIWLNKNLTFNKDFISDCTDDFMADAFPLVIPGAKDDINAWAGDKTHGRVNDIIQSEDQLSQAELVLCNALYYLGDWEVPFIANRTYDGDFASPRGDVSVSYMNDERTLPYYSNNKFSLVSLSFKSEGSAGRYAMAFLLPARGTDMAAMLSSLNAESFSEALAGLKDTNVKIKLPKFEYSFFTSFKDTLKALGMGEAFTGSADFSAMTGGDNDIYISDVLHKCYIKIDELGAEAAAVTVVIAPTCGPPQDTPEFYADRPFAFAIYSQEDGAIAFLGAVNDPTQK